MMLCAAIAGYATVVHTGSDVAVALLRNWKDSVTQFVKVMPMDYKAALEKRKTNVAAVIKG